MDSFSPLNTWEGKVCGVDVRCDGRNICTFPPDGFRFISKVETMSTENDDAGIGVEGFKREAHYMICHLNTREHCSST